MVHILFILFFGHTTTTTPYMLTCIFICTNYKYDIWRFDMASLVIIHTLYTNIWAFFVDTQQWHHSCYHVFSYTKLKLRLCCRACYVIINMYNLFSWIVFVWKCENLKNLNILKIWKISKFVENNLRENIENVWKKYQHFWNILQILKILKFSKMFEHKSRRKISKYLIFS